MDEAAFRAAVAAEGYGPIEVLERALNLFNAEHQHDFAVAAFVLEGELSVLTATGTTTCRDGDCFRLGAGIPHSEQYGAQGARVLVARKAAG